MNERTCDAIFLRTLDTGGYEVMNLRTGKMATAWKLYEVPMTNDIIKRIESLGERDGIKPRLTFEHRSRNNEEYEEEEENNTEHNTESDYNPPHKEADVSANEDIKVLKCVFLMRLNIATKAVLAVYPVVQFHSCD